MISSYNNEKVDLLNIIIKNYGRELDENEYISRFLRKFLAYEIMPLDESMIE
jgi:hypothetical protein